AGALLCELPGWAGSVDLLPIATPDSSEPGLSPLSEHAYRRGCALVAVAPARSPLASMVDASPSQSFPMAIAPHYARETLHAAARLDKIAEQCGPAIAAYSNPATALAAELAAALPVVWTEGVSAGPAGRRFAAALAELSGRPAVVAELPEALAAHSALLAGPL